LAKGRVKEEDQEPRIDGLQFYTSAFRELSSCRPVGMSAGPIPFTAIVEYFKVYPEGEFEEFHFLMRQMDDAYLKFHLDKENSKSKGK
jgi:hypothetical protein